MSAVSTPLTIPDLSVPELVWKRCNRLCAQVAMVDINNEKASLTFTEFFRKSKNVASFLLERGIKHSDVIGISAPNSPQYAIAMVAIMACGATVAPLNPDYKRGEILQMLKISEPKAVIVNEDGVEIVKSVKDQLSCLKLSITRTSTVNERSTGIGTNQSISQAINMASMPEILYPTMIKTND